MEKNYHWFLVPSVWSKKQTTPLSSGCWKWWAWLLWWCQRLHFLISRGIFVVFVPHLIWIKIFSFILDVHLFFSFIGFSFHIHHPLSFVILSCSWIVFHLLSPRFPFANPYPCAGSDVNRSIASDRAAFDPDVKILLSDLCASLCDYSNLVIVPRNTQIQFVYPGCSLLNLNKKLGWKVIRPSPTMPLLFLYNRFLKWLYDFFR